MATTETDAPNPAHATAELPWRPGHRLAPGERDAQHALIQNAVDRKGATVTLTSAMDRGSIFRLNLPVGGREKP